MISLFHQVFFSITEGYALLLAFLTFKEFLTTQWLSPRIKSLKSPDRLKEMDKSKKRRGTEEKAEANILQAEEKNKPGRMTLALV